MHSSLHVKGFELSLRLGLGDEERANKQTVMINMNLTPLEESRALSTDDIADTICYDTLMSKLSAKFSPLEYKLIETLSADIAREIQKYAPNYKIEVELIKHPPIVGFKGTVAYRVTL